MAVPAVPGAGAQHRRGLQYGWLAAVLLALLLGGAVRELQRDEDSNFDWGAPPPWPVFRAAVACTRGLERLRMRLLPPPVQLLDISHGPIHAQALYAAAKLGIADLLAGGALPIGELAAAAGARPDRLHRVLRHLETLGVFKQGPRGVWANSRGSGALRIDHPNSVRAGILHMGWEAHRAHSFVHPSLLEGEDATAFQLFSGVPSFWNWLDKPENEEVNANLNQAMTELNSLSRPALLADFPWRKHGNGTVCDVGGGVGHLLAALLEAHPGMRGVLFDRPSAIHHAKQVWAERHAHLLQRVEFVEGSFFEKVPPADVHVLQHVLHDWNDEACVKILRAVRAAMPPGGKGRSTLVIAEIVLPLAGAPPSQTGLDLQMMAFVDGKERDEAEWRELLTAGGFALRKVHQLRALRSAIEAAPA